METENWGILQRWYGAGQINNFATSLKQTLVPLAVCVSATRGNIPDEKLLENGTRVPAESWERDVFCKEQTQMLSPFWHSWALVILCVAKQHEDLAVAQAHGGRKRGLFLFCLVIRRWQEQRLPLCVASYSVLQILGNIHRIVLFVMFTYVCRLSLWQCTFLAYAQGHK